MTPPLATPRSRASGALPSWARALLAIDGAASRLHILQSAAVEAAMCLFIDPSRRQAFTIEAYDEQAQYVPSSAAHRQGLLAWEREAIGAPPFPASGHLLLGGAGGGRELEALCRLGYTVTAFEPAISLVRGAKAVGVRYAGTTVVQASYEDLVRHSRGESTPFRSCLGCRFDGVIFGLGSFTHVVEEDDRRSLMRALQIVAPGAPVLLSYNTRPDGQTGRRRIRRLQTMFDRLGIHTADMPSGLGFTRQYGFRYAFTEAEISHLAVSTGYQVVATSLQGFPHAILAPSSPSV